jgi:hypothetical protein
MRPEVGIRLLPDHGLVAERRFDRPVEALPVLLEIIESLLEARILPAEEVIKRVGFSWSRSCAGRR